MVRGLVKIGVKELTQTNFVLLQNVLGLMSASFPYMHKGERTNFVSFGQTTSINVQQFVQNQASFLLRMIYM